jgi:hypothetical protein
MARTIAEPVAADGGTTRRRLLALLASPAAGLLPARGLGAPSRIPPMTSDVAFTQPLFATPLVAWTSATRWTATGVFGSSQRRTREVKAVQFDRSGRELAQFGPKLSPGQVVLGVEPNGTMTLVTGDGLVVRRSPEGAERTLARVPELAMPVAVLRTDRSRPEATLVVSAEFKPLSTSKAAFAILRDGVPSPGFPFALGGVPEACDPCIDWRQARAYVALADSSIDGIDLRKAERLPGFPVTLPRERGRPVGGHRLALTPQGDAVLVTMRSGAPVRVEVAPGRPVRVVASPAVGAPGAAERYGALALIDERVLVGFDLASNRLVELDEGGSARTLLAHPAGKPHDAMHLLGSGDTLLGVGISSSGEDDKVAELFEARAPQDVKARIQALADRHAQRKAGGGALDADQAAAREQTVREMKRTWLENNQGLVATNAAVQAAQSVSLQLFTAGAGALQALGPPRIVPSVTDETGIAACPSLAPTLALDAQREVRGFFVGLNSSDRYGASPTAAPSMGIFVPLRT